MEHLFLRNMLLASSLVMYVYSIFSFLSISPKGEEYRSYRIARKIFGSYMGIVATSLLAHWYFDFRGQNPLLASSLCMIYFIIGTMTMSVVLSSLIQGEYPFAKRLRQIAMCAAYLAVVLTLNYHFVPQAMQSIALVVCGVIYIIISIVISVRFYKSYRRTIKRADNLYSDNVGRLLEWIPIALYFIIVMVFAGAILPFLSKNSLIPIFLILGILVYTFIFLSLQNYLINVSKMKVLLLTTNTPSESPEQLASEPIKIEVENRESKAVRLKLERWVARRGFTKQGITIDELALELNTNRTYLSSYINTIYNQSFRGWIATQRIEYSKELLLQEREFSVATIATKVGYTPNAYIKIFTKTEGLPPVQWRQKNR